MTDEIWPRLLAFLRGHLGDQEIDLAGRPRPAGGAAFSDVFRFELSGSTGPWVGPLVLRLYPTHAPPHQVRVEAAMQTGVNEGGLPAPRPLVAVEDIEVLGSSFMVMAY